MTNGVETRFKKGHTPHNIKPIGHLSICKGYITIKTEEGYKKLHRVIWEQHNGKIPPFKLVIFKDGNNRNFDIDNLELVEKVHHMLKNHPMKYPQDIKEAINIKREIIKYINKHGKKQD